MISQIKDSSQTIPQLDEDLEILPFNQVEYLLQHKTLNYQININTQTYDLLKLIDGKKTIGAIQNEYKTTYNIDVSNDFIHTLLYDKLAKYGVVKQNTFQVEKRKKASYLRLSFIFLPSNWVKKITPYLSFLFYKPLFYCLLVTMTAFIATMISLNYTIITNNSSNLLSLNLILYIIAFHFGSIFHELGHATACSKFGARHGGIGFGFYIFFPVLFADVSDAWRLTEKERIIVNLGGLYFEMIIASILLIIYLINGALPYLVIPCVLMLHTIYNLNPLIKYDGYWVLSDATKTPNLHQTAFERLKGVFQKIFLKKGNYNFKKKDLFLVSYAFLSMSFIIFFLMVVIIMNPDSVLKLPLNIYEYLKSTNDIRLGTLSQFFLPCLFWYLLIKLFINMIKKFKVGRIKRFIKFSE